MRMRIWMCVFSDVIAREKGSHCYTIHMRETHFSPVHTRERGGEREREGERVIAVPFVVWGRGERRGGRGRDKQRTIRSDKRQQERKVLTSHHSFT